MKNTTRWLIVMSVLCVGLFARPVLAQDSFVGLYAHARDLVGGEGTVLGIAPLTEIRFSVSVVNEEGHEALYLANGLNGFIDVELWRADARLGLGSLEFTWQPSRRYAFDGRDHAETLQAGVLSVGVGVMADLAVRRKGGEPFPPGDYHLRLVGNPRQLLRPDGSSWFGRGGVGGTTFRLLDATDPKHRDLARILTASKLMREAVWTRAVAIYEEMLGEGTRTMVVLAGLGTADYLLGRNRKALSSLSEALKLAQEEGLESVLPWAIAKVYVAMGRVEKALEILGVDPRDPAAEATIQRLVDEVGRDQSVVS